MIVVSGTMRSGTSMWMQILVAAGLSHIGEAFPQPWGEALRAANPRGFYESQLVAGIYHATNPHPETGTYLFPEQTQRHAVKVFIPGLVRTDVAFIDRVVATVRDWRQYAASLNRMNDLGAFDRGKDMFEVPISPALRWWTENFALIRDIATRRYAAHVTTYGRMLDDPEREVDTVMKWLGLGDSPAARRAVEPSLRTQLEDTPGTLDVSAQHAAVFDEFYAHLHEGRDLSPAFVALLNQTDLELRPRLVEAREEVRTQLASRLAAATPPR